MSDIREKWWTYYSENNDCVKVVRNSRKGFERMPKGDFGKIRPLYSERGWNSPKSILVVEGEKKVDRALSYGIPATCAIGGAANAANADWSAFGKGDRVTLWPDRDHKGFAGFRKLADLLEKQGVDVYWVQVPKCRDPDRPEGDGADIYDRHEFPQEVAADLVAGATSDPPGSEGYECPFIAGWPEWKKPGGGCPFAPFDVARHFLKRREDVSYNATAKRWARFGPVAWDTGPASHLATTALLMEFLESDFPEEKRNHDRAAVREVLGLSAALRHFDESGLDPDPDIFVCRDRYLLLNPDGTATREDPTPGRMAARVSGAAFRKGAECPKWEDFVEQCCTGADGIPRPDMEDYLQVVFGQAMFGRNDEQKLFVLTGSGGNGKSVMMDVLDHVFGDYSRKVDAEGLFGERRHTESTAALRGVRLGFIEEGVQFLNTGHMKVLTGGGRISARRNFGHEFQFEPVMTLVMSCNELPRLGSVDDAIRRRIRVIPFDNTPAEKNPRLTRELVGEAPGILNWLLGGYAKWCGGVEIPMDTDGFLPNASREATEDYFKSQDAVHLFIEDRCDTGPGQEVGSGQLYMAYQNWCTENGIRKPWTKQRLSKDLSRRGYPSRHTMKGKVREGISLRPDL